MERKMNTCEVMHQYRDGLVIKWNNSIWVVRADGDQPSLWPVAIVERNAQGRLSFKIPKGTDIANANAVLASLIGINDFFK
jgi:hypothetical protein